MSELYHVLNHESQQTSNHTSFASAMTAIGDLVDNFPDVFTLTFDGEGEAMPYEVECGEADPGPWFTNYVDDTPDYKTWASQQAMKNHLKEIDDLAHGIL